MGRMAFFKRLNAWYEDHKRDLPWRRTRDPYRVWLSEVILQQTRVDQGKTYYARFIWEFPTVQDLADASLDRVMRLWQGLGYYNRARNLHATAHYLAHERNGEFPDNYEDLLVLKGVGDYTASAIASFCFDEARPVLDGNVKRVLARLYGMEGPIDSTTGQKQLHEWARGLIDRKDPGRFNQAIMEFGALHCKPVKPLCQSCPFRENCVAHQKGIVNRIPVKSPKRKKRRRFFNYLIIREEGGLYLQKRDRDDIWKGLYEFPLIETERRTGRKKLEEHPDFLEIGGKRGKISARPLEYTHELTHQRIIARFWELRKDPDHFSSRGKMFRVPYEKIEAYALPRLLLKFLERSPLSG